MGVIIEMYTSIQTGSALVGFIFLGSIACYQQAQIVHVAENVQMTRRDVEALSAVVSDINNIMRLTPRQLGMIDVTDGHKHL